MRIPCKCSLSRVLPKGLICDRGYLLIRLFPGKGHRPHLEGCKEHSVANERLAILKLNDYRKEIFLGRFNAQTSGKAITVSDAFDVYIKFGSPSRNIIGVIERILRPTFGRFAFHELPPSEISIWREKRLDTCLVHPDGHKENVDKSTCRLIKFSTVNREQTALHSVYSAILGWVRLKKDGVPRILVPSDNPCKGVPKPSEKQFARERVPEREELKAAKMWCREHDPELWQTIFRATVTMLRKSDFRSSQESGAKDGIQGKTGLRFKIRAHFPNPISLVNWRKRWEALQRAMGWTEYQDGKPNPRHTVWHDIRHWGPSLLGEAGFTSDFIRRLTGHASTQMADRYTHLRESKLEEAVGLISKEMEEL